MTMTEAELSRLIERQKPGWTLEQPLYVDPDVYALEAKHIMPRQWMMLGHASELAEKGSYVVRTMFGEQIILVRTGPGDDDIRAFFNVCSHRGSIICKEHGGKAARFTCPYHAWSFALDGRLLTKVALPEGVDPSTMGLRPCAMRVVHGVIIAGLSEDLLPDPSAGTKKLDAILTYHGLARTRVVARKSYVVKANWKLVVENAMECYHCRLTHPEYTSVNKSLNSTGTLDMESRRAWHDEYSDWLPNDPSGLPASQIDIMTAGADPKEWYVNYYRTPIGNGKLTITEGGRPVARTLGTIPAHDGADSMIQIGRLGFISAASDHATMIQILPRSADETDMVLTWLVHEDAGLEVDADAVSWMWHWTTVQDKQISEDNAQGVHSVAYRPGPYSILEEKSGGTIAIFLKQLHLLLSDEEKLAERA